MIQFTAFQVICTFYYAALHTVVIDSCFLFASSFSLSVCELRQCAQRRQSWWVWMRKKNPRRTNWIAEMFIRQFCQDNVGTIFSLVYCQHRSSWLCQLYGQTISHAYLHSFNWNEICVRFHWIQVTIYWSNSICFESKYLPTRFVCVKHWTHKNTQWCLLTLQKNKFFGNFQKCDSKYVMSEHSLNKKYQ